MANQECAWLLGELERATASGVDTLVTATGRPLNKESRSLVLAHGIRELARNESQMEFMYNDTQRSRMFQQAEQLAELIRRFDALREADQTSCHCLCIGRPGRRVTQALSPPNPMR